MLGIKLFAKKIRKIHFVGIGGIGMSGIAEVMYNMGFKITGSDIRETELTKRLENLGIKVFYGHKSSHVEGKDLIVYSSAVKGDNIELIEAQRLGIPCIPRAEMLSELMRLKAGIAVGGTHGKTTTTSMIATIFERAELDPTIIIGGRLRSLKTNARLGSGDFLICEADESDKLFLKLTPIISVITSIDDDHLDNYKDINEIKEAFTEFANNVPFYGCTVICADDENTRSILDKIHRKYVTYGLKGDYDITAKILEVGAKSIFEVKKGNKNLGEFILNLPGIHNIRNALASIGVALEVGIPPEIIKDALKDFSGVHRRLEFIGEFNGVKVYDDYAHHPTEIMVTLESARMIHKGRIIVIFQPHLFSRTVKLQDKFGRAFTLADRTIVTKIYPAREKPMEGVTGEIIVQRAKESGYSRIEYIEDFDDVVESVKNLVKPGDMVITIGAGDVYKIARKLVGNE